MKLKFIFNSHFQLTFGWAAIDYAALDMLACDPFRLRQRHCLRLHLHPRPSFPFTICWHLISIIWRVSHGHVPCQGQARKVKTSEPWTHFPDIQQHILFGFQLSFKSTATTSTNDERLIRIGIGFILGHATTSFSNSNFTILFYLFFACLISLTLLLCVAPEGDALWHWADSWKAVLKLLQNQRCDISLPLPHCSTYLTP